MVADFTRVNTLELKDLIYQRIGQQRADMYFDQLKRFLSLKLSKVDFYKSCIQSIGRENLSLHNRLIQSIVQNACHAKIPPKKARKVEALSVKVSNGHQRSHLQSLYGDAFPQSPLKCRSPVSRDRKIRDRPSPLGPLGKSPSLTCETVSRLQEQQSAAELQSLSGRPRMGIASVEEGEEVEQLAVMPTSQRWSSITAPLSVSLDTGGARKARHSGSSFHKFAETCQSTGELPDTKFLGCRLQKKLALEGVGISLDGANLLNKSLDVFLKRIIVRSMDVAGSRCAGPFTIGRKSNGQMVSGFNGMFPGRYEETVVQPTSASMLDFRVAMESNPSILGEDWSIQLEKICNSALQ